MEPMVKQGVPSLMVGLVDLYGDLAKRHVIGEVLDELERDMGLKTLEIPRF